MYHNRYPLRTSFWRGPEAERESEGRTLRRGRATGRILEFAAAGSTKRLAEAIEQHGRQNGPLHEIVVPWESDSLTLRMAVTLVNSDGWAIEHTNLSTVTLTDLGHDHTHVALVAHATDHLEQQRLTPLLDTFGRHLQDRCQARVGGTDRVS